MENKTSSGRRVTNNDVEKAFAAVLSSHEVLEKTQQEMIEIQSSLSASMGAIMAQQKKNAEELSDIREAVQENAQAIQRLDVAIRGNGKQGLLERVAVLSTKFEGLDREKTQPLKEGKDEKNKENEISKTWIVDKFIVPFVLAFAYWFFFQILPKILPGLQQ